MAKRLYTKVSPEVWTSRRFRSVDTATRCLYLYLLTNAHIDSSGCYRLPVAYGCSDFGTDRETYLDCIGKLVTADMIAHDADAEYVLIKRWFKHNPLTNLDHAEGTRRLVNEIESETLRIECQDAFEEADQALRSKLERAAAEKQAKVAKAAEWAAKATQSANPIPLRQAVDLTQTNYMSGTRR